MYRYKRDIIKRLNSKCSYTKDEDFCVGHRKSTGGRPTETITLTIDCFKNICMMANNNEGKKVRTYYLILEKYLKNIVKKNLTVK